MDETNEKIPSERQCCLPSHPPPSPSVSIGIAFLTQKLAPSLLASAI
jgi:hypothetical protein